jgi:hypothetical protein
MKKPTKVKMGISPGIYNLQRVARRGRRHFAIKIEVYYVL